MQFETTIQDQVFNVEIDSEGSGVQVNGNSFSYELMFQENGRVLFRTGTKLYKIDNISVDNQKVSFSLNGRFTEAVVKNEQELLLEKLGFKTGLASQEGRLHAPMPGKILELLVQEGDSVEAGQPVIILEAMKMENELKAPIQGKVATLQISQNDNVEKNQPLLEIEPRG
ncbi:MAG: acetyl-CoA carboxylase biotin carboxyl carrier protein subunit [Balneolaceae bacterium]